MPEERIQKVLAAAGVASRRQAEVLVATGRVRIDGVVAVVGQKVDPLTSIIEVNGAPVGFGTVRAYVALHKPAGVTSTTKDRHAATTVLDLIPTALVPDGTRLYPVGRLDLDSEGLLLLTNDGEWAERVLHPRFGVEREYAVAVAQPLSPDQVGRLNAGIRVEEGMARLSVPLRATTSVENRTLAGAIDPSPDPSLVWYRATLAQGWKRQLRRMFGAVDAPILRLVRVRIGIVRLGDLHSGRSRNLKAPEIKAMAGLASSSENRRLTGDASGSISGRGRAWAEGGPRAASPKRPTTVKPHKGRPQGPRTPAPKPSEAAAPGGRKSHGEPQRPGRGRPPTSRHRET
ncbi:MAG: rRNA pseudouridine synthase [Chloroflexi bacterium]|nr:rRNA pseudouridine synthase [Chloroflexota bacterium]